MAKTADVQVLTRAFDEREAALKGELAKIQEAKSTTLKLLGSSSTLATRGNKRGRKAAASTTAPTEGKRPRGRPKGSTNKPKPATEETTDTPAQTEAVA